MELREGANVNPADANLQYVRMDYDQIVVGLRADDGTDRTVEIIATGPIGLQWWGLWDETRPAKGSDQRSFRASRSNH